MTLRGVKGLQQGLSQLKNLLCVFECLRWLTVSRPPRPDRRRNQGSDLSSRPKRPALCSPAILDPATTMAVLFSANLQCSCRPWFTLLWPSALHKQHLPAINPWQALSNARTTLSSATPNRRPCCFLNSALERQTWGSLAAGQFY